jgi:hypothetical protein
VPLLPQVPQLPNEQVSPVGQVAWLAVQTLFMQQPPPVHTPPPQQT